MRQSKPRYNPEPSRIFFQTGKQYTFLLTNEETEIENVELLVLTAHRYGRVFHPQPLLHQLIASLVIYHMTNQNEISHGYPEIPQSLGFDSCPYYPSDGSNSSASGRAYCRISTGILGG